MRDVKTLIIVFCCKGVVAMMTLLKKKSVFSVGVLLVMMMLIPITARATCYSIDDYIMPNGRRILCFGDVHIDSFDGAKTEQDVLVGVAQERGAYCIVEDSLGYKGNDLRVSNVRDEWLYSSLVSMHDGAGSPMTALLGSAGRFAAEGIDCHNAECRHADIAYSYATYASRSAEELGGLYEAMIQEIEEVFYEVRAKSNMSQDNLAALRRKCDRVITDLRHGGGIWQKDDLDALYFELFDLKLVAHLEQVLANQGDNRPIFIFAGAAHTRAVDKYLRQRCDVHKERPVRNYRVQSSVMVDLKRMKDISDRARWLEEADKFIKKYRVDIRGYFAQEDARSAEKEGMARNEIKPCITQ